MAGAILSSALAFTLAFPVSAVYRPSVVANDEPTTEKAQIQLGNGTFIDLTPTEPGSYQGLLDDQPEPRIQVTPVKRTEEYRNRSTGLNDKTNELTNTVFDAIQDSKTTSELLDKLPKQAKEAFEKALPEGKKTEDFEPFNLFDVSMNEVARKQLGDGKVLVDIKVPGVKKGDEKKLIALHLHSNIDSHSLKDIKDMKSLTKTVDKAEALKLKVEKDGVIGLEMSDFSPVVLFKLTGEVFGETETGEKKSDSVKTTGTNSAKNVNASKKTTSPDTSAVL